MVSHADVVDQPAFEKAHHLVGNVRANSLPEVRWIGVLYNTIIERRNLDNFKNHF